MGVDAAHRSGIAVDPYALVESNSRHILSLAVQEHIVGGLVLDAGAHHTVRIPQQWVSDFLRDRPDDGDPC